MATFPQSFVKEMQSLPPDLILESANAAVEELAEKGFVVEAGITPYVAGVIGQMAAQDHIVEFCPKDQTAARFETEASTQQWVTKDGGRGVFIISRVIRDDGRRPVGYGWTGFGRCDELPTNPVTFAERLGKEGLYQHLAVPFAKVIIGGTTTLYDIDPYDIGLETWASNSAVKKYEAAGFEQIAEQRGSRPTLEEVGAEINGHVVMAGEASNVVGDTRLFMVYTGPTML